MNISLLIPCWNEEQSIRKSVQSWLYQSRRADQIIVVDDSSTDGTREILQDYADIITIVRTPVNLGNKSYAQEFGLQFVTGDVFIATDADTLLQYDFIERIEKNFEDPAVAAVGGYVCSIRNNWLTRNRAFEYAIGQNFHKLAQSFLNCMFVIPGAAGAFRTDVFRTHLSFDHDTIAEDLDFTYKLHRQGLKLTYDMKAVVYTQDPSTFRCYIKQMRRWFGGGWQNLLKNYDIVRRPGQALELSLMYIEGVIFSLLLLLLPFVNLYFALVFMAPYFIVAFFMSVYAARRERRWDLLLASVPYVFLFYLNAYLFLEQFVSEVVLRRRNLVWVSPKRAVL